MLLVSFLKAYKLLNRRERERLDIRTFKQKREREREREREMRNIGELTANWTVRTNPEGRICNHKAKMIIYGKAEFDCKAENISNLIYA